MTLPLFLYGTLLRPAVLERMAGQRGLAPRLRPARLWDHARVFLRGSGLGKRCWPVERSNA